MDGRRWREHAAGVDGTAGRRPEKRTGDGGAHLADRVGLGDERAHGLLGLAGRVEAQRDALLALEQASEQRGARDALPEQRGGGGGHFRVAQTHATTSTRESLAKVAHATTSTRETFTTEPGRDAMEAAIALIVAQLCASTAGTCANTQ